MFPPSPLRQPSQGALTWSRLLCVDAHCCVLWGLPGDVLAAPETSLVWLDRCNTSIDAHEPVSAISIYTAGAGWNRGELILFCYPSVHLPAPEGLF